MKEDVTQPGEIWIDTVDTGQHSGCEEVNAGISIPRPAVTTDQIKTETPETPIRTKNNV